MIPSVILREFFVLCHSEEVFCQVILRSGATKNLAEVEYSEILRGVYPEPTWILRCAQNDDRRRTQKDNSEGLGMT